MLIVREVVNCKPGQAGALIKKFKALGGVMTALGERPFRIMSDFTGEQFWSVVLEFEAEGVDAFRAMEDKVMSNPKAREAMAGYHDLVLQGRREIYKLEG